MITSRTVDDVARFAARIRLRAVKMVAPHGFGYLGQALSSAELLAALFSGPYRAGRDRLVCSPGHYIIGVFAAARELGLLDDAHWRPTGRTDHPWRRSGPSDPRSWISPADPWDRACPAGPRFALSDQMRGDTDPRVFVLLSDGELEEGQTWEAAMFAAHRKLDHLVVLLDANDSQVDGPVSSITTIEPIAAKWASFGWQALDVDGHDPEAVSQAIATAVAEPRPSVVIARTSTVHGLDCLPDGRRRSLHQAPPGARPMRRSPNWRPALREPPYPTVLKPYGRALVELAREREEIVCLSGDLTRQCEVDLFEHEIPERFINAGMAEANMISMAGALARRGHIPFVHTFGVFATRRPLDQIVNSVAYPNLPVRIVGFMPGVSSPGGPSHQAIEDVALMRALPNMTVIDVADAVEIGQAVRLIADLPGPAYLRLKRGEIPVIFAEDHGLSLERAPDPQARATMSRWWPADDVSAALAAAVTLADAGVSASVINVPVIKPLDGDTILEAASARPAVVTAENHSVIGGLGSAVAEVLAEAGLARPLRRVGLQDTFAEGAQTAASLFLKYGWAPRTSSIRPGACSTAGAPRRGRRRRRPGGAYSPV